MSHWGIVIQGPLKAETLGWCQDLAREAPVVVSTWTGSGNPDAYRSTNGATVIVSDPPAGTNRFGQYQFFSTLAGIRALPEACTHVVKVRTDEYYETLQPIRDLAERSPGKLVTTNIFFRFDDFRKFHPSDHVVAGERTVMEATFAQAIELHDQGPSRYRGFDIQHPEQLLALGKITLSEPMDPPRSADQMKRHFVCLPLDALGRFKVVSNTYARKFLPSVLTRSFHWWFTDAPIGNIRTIEDLDRPRGDVKNQAISEVRAKRAYPHWKTGGIKRQLLKKAERARADYFATGTRVVINRQPINPEECHAVARLGCRETYVLHADSTSGSFTPSGFSFIPWQNAPETDRETIRVLYLNLDCLAFDGLNLDGALDYFSRHRRSGPFPDFEIAAGWPVFQPDCLMHTVMACSLARFQDLLRGAPWLEQGESRPLLPIPPAALPLKPLRGSPAEALSPRAKERAFFLSGTYFNFTNLPRPLARLIINHALFFRVYAVEGLSYVATQKTPVSRSQFLRAMLYPIAVNSRNPNRVLLSPSSFEAYWRWAFSKDMPVLGSRDQPVPPKLPDLNGQNGRDPITVQRFLKEMHLLDLNEDPRPFEHHS
ncbi:MAG: hypothetical protein ACFE0O_15475 [Opitutales bacterium]